MKLLLKKSIKEHSNSVWSLSVKKNDTTGQPLLLASGSSDKQVKIHSLTSDNYNLYETLDSTVHKKTISSVSWRPNTLNNQLILAASSFDTTTSIWGKEEEETDFELLALIEGHENEVKSCQWSHNGRYLATCSRDKSVWIWEADEFSEEFECVAVLQEHDQDIKNVAWHPDQLMLATSSYDDTVKIYIPYDDDWECVASLEGHKGTVWCSAFESGLDFNTRLVTCSDDLSLIVWELIEDSIDEDEGQIWEIQSKLPDYGHSRQIYGCAWNEKNGLIASVGADGKIVIYKETRGKGSGEWSIVAEQNDAHSVYEINCVIWIDEKTLATGGDDGLIKIWSLN
ncbi:WD40 repeat-like protein [Hanseniaspora valbyensis NRRL Y-1626]|uniref:Probable cytosolic iron-sulfur protein assembly protein 1 n=1 Tax=Hanseniaspora valbyensis NRRL Y-1626 TaxID=766949 RepID=A0A1B7TD46_9ASCO|nr:WD40 repeat-like protein [Hanseniaspora valbyensis NRRL Y-1626]